MSKRLVEYRMCSRCIMDTTAQDISFDENGVCSYCTNFLNLLNRVHFNETLHRELLERTVKKIKKSGKNENYDCIVGVSGGLDSSFVLYNARKLGLRPLAVHLDNGWNSELAVSNIEKLVKSLNVDLYTHVINWEEFKDLQIAFFKAHVVDIELLTDHAITAILYKIAHERQIRYLVSGTNVASEGMRIPPNWAHLKIDFKNIKAIYKRFGNGKRLETFPTIGLVKYVKYTLLDKIKWLSILDFMPYKKDEAIQILIKETGWRPYEKKHYESIFTRFYQGYILPKKFNIDKRKLHYSTLICSGQMSIEKALELLRMSTYDNQLLLKEDEEYVLKKLGFSPKEFEEYLNSPPVSHDYYPSSEWSYNKLAILYNKLG